MSDIARRKQIEERIVRASESVEVSKPLGGWLDDKEIEVFLDTWYELVQFYQEHDDTMLDVEVIREYVRFVRLLNLLVSNMNLDDDHRDQAETTLEELEGYMDEIVKEAVTNKHSG